MMAGREHTQKLTRHLFEPLDGYLRTHRYEGQIIDTTLIPMALA